MKEKVKKLEAVKGTQEYDKAKYMEGAVWMGKKMSNDIEKLCSSVDLLI